MGELRTSLEGTIELLKRELSLDLKTEEARERDISQLQQELRDNLQSLKSKLLALPKESAVLRRLSFDAMFRREDAVVDPEHGTFQWILGGIQPEVEDREESRYVNWPSSRLKYAFPSGASKNDVVGASRKPWGSELNHSQMYDSEVSDEPVFLKSRLHRWLSGTWSSSGGDEDAHEERHIDKESGTEVNSDLGSLEDEVQQDHSTPTTQQFHNADFPRPTTKTSGLKLHGVYNRSSPSIFKIHGNEPNSGFPHAPGAVTGWMPHLQHLMLISEYARRQQMSKAFASFLRHGQGVYFCSGKAGSGKSTFMKYISRHELIIRELRIWSGAKKLVLINIFFWNSGDEMQMSIEGFYRSLLFQVLQQCPESLPEIFPHQVEGEVEFLQDIRGNLLPFRFPELQEAVRRLLKTSRFPNHRFCFFIDGLDEFKGGSVEHVRFAQALKDWASDDVKVVCSARPYTEFLDTFTDSLRTIHLHEWTKDDIHHYASSGLYSGLVSSGMPTQSGTMLAGYIAHKADGVFIWARLVVQSLVEGMMHRDSIRVLYERVEQAPRDLNHLYEKILESIDPVIRVRSENALGFVAHCPFQTINAMAFTWLEDLEDNDFPMNRPFQTYSWKEIQDRQELARRQVALLTRGLAEVRPSASRCGIARPRLTAAVVGFFDTAVVFHHLSAKEFLATTVLKSAGTEFPELIRDRYARLVLAEVKFSGGLQYLLPDFRTIYKKARGTSIGLYAFHPVPDKYLDELAACFPSVQNDPKETIPRIGIYDQGSYGQFQISLSAPGRFPLFATVNESVNENENGLPSGLFPKPVYNLLWRGPVPNLLICYALSFHQTGYILRRLQNGTIHVLTDEELAIWLFITWAMCPDPAITEYILCQRGLPQQPIEAMNYIRQHTLSFSSWFGFLAVLSTAVQPQFGIHRRHPAVIQLNSSSASPCLPPEQSYSVEMLCQTLEHLLKHGVDSDMVYLLKESTIRHASDIEEKDKLSDWVVEEETISYYMELETLLETIQPPPPNLPTLWHLLGVSPSGRLRAAAGSAFTGLTQYLGVIADNRLTASRKMYKPVSGEEWRSGRLTICGMVSKDEVLEGPFSIIVY